MIKDIDRPVPVGTSGGGSGGGAPIFYRNGTAYYSRRKSWDKQDEHIAELTEALRAMCSEFGVTVGEAMDDVKPTGAEMMARKALGIKI